MSDHQAVIVDRSGRQEVEYRPLKPVIFRAAEIEQEIERLSEGSFRGSRRSSVVHPGLPEGNALFPACTMSINVLLPGERTVPHRHNSSVINFGMRGKGSAIVGGRRVEWDQYDTFTTPPWMVHQHINESDEVHVRFSYSNSGLLDRLGVHVIEATQDLDPNQPLGDPRAELDKSRRGEVVGENGESLITYEQLLSPQPPYQPALHWPWPVLKERLDTLKALGQEYKGRRLFLMYDPSTGRAQGTTNTFFATITMRPGGIVDQPHRHTSAAINYYFAGSGWSMVGGERYEWSAGDLMLSAPGWMPHGHASDPGEDVYEITVQDSPLQINLGSLLWVENLKGRTEALGVTKGFETNRAEVATAG